MVKFLITLVDCKHIKLREIEIKLEDVCSIDHAWHLALYAVERSKLESEQVYFMKISEVLNL